MHHTTIYLLTVVKIYSIVGLVFTDCTEEKKERCKSYLILLLESEYTATITPASQLHASHDLTCLK